MGVKRKVKMRTDDGIVTLGEAFVDFTIDKGALNRSPKTLANYAQSIRYFADSLPDGDATALNEISKQDIQEWMLAMFQDKMRVSTINHYLRDLRTFLYWCMAKERKYIYPFTIELAKGQEDLPKMFSDEEVALLLIKPTHNNFVDWRTWAICNWVLATGNRASTICNVRMCDIDFKNKQIALAHTKNKKAQVIPLSSALETALRLYIRKCRNGKDVYEDSWLFPSVSEEQLTYSALAQSFRKYCKDRDLEHTNIHGLRHYFATYWAKNNRGDGDRLQLILGHTDYTMTKRYIDLTIEDLKENYDDYNPLDSMKKPKSHRKKVNMA